MNSPVIIFERVSYFCENSRSTLLSVSAFKKFNTYFHVNTNFDTISLLSPSGKLVLCSSSYQKTDTWPVKQPLQTPHAPPVKGLNSFTYPAAEHIQMKSVSKSPNCIESSQFTWDPASTIQMSETYFVFQMSCLLVP